MTTAPTDITALPCTCSAIRRAARHVTQSFDRHIAPSGLRATQYGLLRQLAQCGPVNVHVLARTLGMDRTTLGRNLQPLERAGLVSVVTAPNDRRVRLVEVTAAGTGRLATARPLWQRAQSQLEARFGADAILSLHHLLQDLVAPDPDTDAAGTPSRREADPDGVDG